MKAHNVRVGGWSKEDLLIELERRGVRLNDAARELFSDPRFTTLAEPRDVSCVQLSVAELGHPHGATVDAWQGSAFERGLALCPLELGPHLRLQYLDQVEATQPASRHAAPPGSVTIASAPLSDDCEAPRGFYLRRIAGELWLRGYRSGPDHVWSPEDLLVFVLPIPSAG